MLGYLDMHAQNIITIAPVLGRRECHNEVHYTSFNTAKNKDGHPLQNMRPKHERAHTKHIAAGTGCWPNLFFPPKGNTN